MALSSSLLLATLPPCILCLIQIMAKHGQTLVSCKSEVGLVYRTEAARRKGRHSNDKDAGMIFVFILLQNEHLVSAHPWFDPVSNSTGISLLCWCWIFLSRMSYGEHKKFLSEKYDLLRRH